ncbi:predicted protein [Nematostella vectensis]|uniref:Uncharacterized protein n=1 Tax=Nematostella vectensis TaxID=45351 RepID=A7SQH5_NEMVE|nr:predicted protein [Nematostella vectensis]|eukprot:XP_001626136.1 predicted protein [Nematostella vectensis]
MRRSLKKWKILFPKILKKQTSWAMKNFTDWCTKRSVQCDFHSISSSDLGGILRRSYAEVKTKDKDLSPSALTGIRAAIHCTITSQPFARTITILKDAEFLQSNKMLEVVCKSYYKRVNPKPEHKSPIEPGDMNTLRSYFDVYSPNKLQEFVWFNLCYNVCIKHTEQKLSRWL